MQKQQTELSELCLIGLTARTNNKNEMNPATAKIGDLAGLYWQNQIVSGLQHRTNPGITYAVYIDYESNEHGDYSYFIGEAVSSLENQDLEKFKTITIPASSYQKFTTPAGAMPDIIITAWKKIWAMQPADFGSRRKYIADFEIYDERAADLENAVVDIYIGVE